MFRWINFVLYRTDVLPAITLKRGIAQRMSTDLAIRDVERIAVGSEWIDREPHE